MIEIKTTSNSQPVAEAIDNEKAVVALDDGTILLSYLDQHKVLSCKLDEQPVQIEIHESNVFVLTKPYPIEIQDDEENEEILTINMLAAKKTGITLWQLEIINNELSIINKREKTGGFSLHNDRLYACDPIKEGFYVLDLGLKEIERIGINIDPTGRKPWFSSIFIIDSILYLIQGDDLMRWFRLNETIEEGGILVPEDRHVTYFLSINNPPKKLIKAGNYVIGTIDSAQSFLINFKDNVPYIVSNPNDYISLKYKELFTFSKNIQVRTERYALANNRYTISIADAGVQEIQYAFWLTEADETLNVTKLSAYGNYAVCFAWTNKRKFPVLVFDMSDLKKPKIKMLINFGGDIDKLTIEEDT